MKKHRITITVEFEIDPENYPGHNTDEERLACDLEAFAEGEVSYLEFDTIVTGETLEMD